MHIYEGIGYGLDSESEPFKNASRYVTAFVVLFWVVGIIEFLIMFHGSTLFSNKPNLLLICFHTVGLISLLYFKSQTTHYKWIMQLWVAFGLVPLAIEVASASSSKYNYRRV